MTTPSIRPRPSYATTAGGDESQSHYASAHSYLHDTTREEDEDTEESMFTAPSTHSRHYYHQPIYADAVERPYRDVGDSSVEILSTVKTPRRPPLIANPSSVSTMSSSSGSDVDMSGPVKSPFFVQPAQNYTRESTKENHNPMKRDSVPALLTTRPTSPLPPLPLAKSSSTVKHLRGPSVTTAANAATPYRAPPLTAHNSLAAFQAANPIARDSKPATSEDSHRTSSDVDLDLSFDYDVRKENQALYSDELYSSSLSTSSSSSKGARSSEGGEGSLERLEHEVTTGGWVGIEMGDHARPQEHGIPEMQLERSVSGKLVGARASKARSALDLRAQFKAAEATKQEEQDREQDVSIIVMRELDQTNQVRKEEEEARRRREIRAGKRTVEGIRVGSYVYHTPGKENLPRSHRRRSAGVGFAYNATESLTLPTPDPRQPPHSAPLASEPVFAVQQQQPQKPAHQVVDLSPFSAELDQAKRTKAFPLPLRLNPKRSSLTAGTSISSPPKLNPKGSRQSLIYYDSDVASPEPSPLFDNHTDDEGGGTGTATNRTAPSTPNDTPLFQECFSDEDTMPPPVPDKEKPGSLAGLGFDFVISGSSPSCLREGHEDFPTVPLRRRSLPPAPTSFSPATRRNSTSRHLPIPSLSVSPPPRTHDRTLEDILESDSSRSSQDSSCDPTISPSRRISRRLSSTNPSSAGLEDSVISRRQSFGHGQTSTPTNSRTGGGGATIITPQHLLVTPSDTGRSVSSGPSFSFSPAPLRLVKAQLLRAAGYRYDHIPTSSPPLNADSPPSSSPSLTSIQHATSSPRKKPATPQPPQLQGPSPVRAPSGDNIDASSTSGSRARGALRRKNRVETTLEELSDLLSSSAETWIDEVIPAKLAFIAGFLLGPWCWIIGGWYLRPHDGELPNSRGTRCRTLTCNCGRVLRGSTSRQQAQHTTRRVRREEAKSEDDWAGLDKWVFGNRVAACGGGVGIAVLVGVAIWAAASA